MSAEKSISEQTTEDQSLTEFAKIDRLEGLMEKSLVEIQQLQEELKDLEQDLNSFFDGYYGASAVFFQEEDLQQADNDNSTDLSQAKKDIYSKIAKVCAHDTLSFSDNNAHENLLKIEGYLTDGTDQCQSPQDLLANISFEYYHLIQQIRELKEKKQNLLDSPAYELKQKVMWADIKTAETISKIKDNLTHQVNKAL